MIKKYSVYIILFLIYTSLNFSTCADSRKLTYFNNIPRDSTEFVKNETDEAIISNNDILQITISTLDEQSSRILNGVISLSGNNTGNQGSGILNGYLVDEAGKVKIPLIGEITAAGLKKKQLATAITNDLIGKKFALDPVVAVRIINYKVTVLGEVNKPGVIPVPNEQITIPEALGQAGDLTPYGKRNSLLLIREVGGKRIFKRFSLRDDKLFDRDFYYLQNRDIIYVEPNNAKAGATDRTTQLLPIIISSLSFLAIIFSQVLTKK